MGIDKAAYKAAYQKQWRLDNPTYKKAHNRKQSMKMYGLDMYDYRALATKGCPICLKAFDETAREPVFDHNHVTGKFRGLLCQRCNRGIGFLGDNADNVNRAMTYLFNGGDSNTIPD